MSAQLSILLAEDNPLNQKLMYFTMKKAGYAIDLASDGREVVDKLASKFYDIVIMDIMMPHIDGLQATAIIRQQQETDEQKSLIIGLTSNVYDSDRERCLTSGMDYFLPKPFSVEAFEAILKERGLA